MKEIEKDELFCRDVFLQAFDEASGRHAAVRLQGVLHQGVQGQDDSDHFETRHLLLMINH